MRALFLVNLLCLDTFQCSVQKRMVITESKYIKLKNSNQVHSNSECFLVAAKIIEHISSCVSHHSCILFYQEFIL